MFRISEFPGRWVRNPDGFPLQIIASFEVLDDRDHCVGWFLTRADAELFIHVKMRRILYAIKAPEVEMIRTSRDSDIINLPSFELTSEEQQHIEKRRLHFRGRKVTFVGDEWSMSAVNDPNDFQYQEPLPEPEVILEK